MKTWKNLKLSGKFFVAFGLLLVLLGIVALLSIFGINGIVGNAEEVISGNKLRTTLTQRHVDHLKWAKQVNQFLNDSSITTLNVETDPHKCKLGEWYYSEERKKAAGLSPEMEKIIKDIEQPHIQLHNSAIKIAEAYTPASRELSTFLWHKKNEHMSWVKSVQQTLLDPDLATFNVEKDPNVCSFGKWLNSDDADNLANQNPEMRNLIIEVKNHHNQVHRSIINAEEYLAQGQRGAAVQYFNNQTVPELEKTLGIIDEMITWNENQLASMKKAQEIYNTQTVKHLNTVGTLLTDLEEKSKNHILTDQKMLNLAENTQQGVLLLSIIAIIFGTILAIVIARGIIQPIIKGVNFAKTVSKGDLTANIDVNQKDEIGQLADALKNMVKHLSDIVSNVKKGADNIASASTQISSTSQNISQGANEQASSTEEVSSNMEEMTSNIQQNTDNARQTEQISEKAADDIIKGNTNVEQTVEAMHTIAEKITIISDIAFQTNILALNAAVEAARAGQHGKGFAVVAAEVRKLAEKAKNAANEINDVSRSSVDIANQSQKVLSEIVPSIQKTATLVKEIATASIEQNSGTDQINTAIQQLNQVTQQNAAASEQMATSSEELSSQATELKNMIEYFKVE